MSLIQRVNFKLRHLSAQNLSLINLYMLLFCCILYCSGSTVKCSSTIQPFTRSCNGFVYTHSICWCHLYCWENSYEIKYENCMKNMQTGRAMSIWLRVFLSSRLRVCLCKRFHYSLFTGVISEIFRKRMEKFTHTHKCQVVNENCIACRSGSWMFNVHTVCHVRVCLTCTVCSLITVMCLAILSFCLPPCHCILHSRTHNLCNSQRFAIQFYISLPLNIYDSMENKTKMNEPQWHTRMPARKRLKKRKREMSKSNKTTAQSTQYEKLRNWMGKQWMNLTRLSLLILARVLSFALLQVASIKLASIWPKCVCTVYECARFVQLKQRIQWQNEIKENKHE